VRFDLSCSNYDPDAHVDNLAALARGEYLRTHFKNMREVAAAISGV